MTGEVQRRPVLTPHPLQRVGAFALARLSGAGHPDQVTPEGFDRATERMTRDAARSALVVFEGGTKAPDGFWLKCSLSFFPNSKMNHPSNGRRTADEISGAVEEWRRMPAPESWPDAPCVLCGRPAVRYFGKVDVPLIESHIYRNTTPRGHEGTALCWPCVCSFYALPYGCRLTGGPSVVLHSWDDGFLRETVGHRLSGNRRILATGRDTAGQLLAREVVALDALRRYEERLHAGVELLVVSNDGRGGSLDLFSMEQPLAEWLRGQAHGRAYGALLRAHHSEKVPGRVGLVRNAFREPARIIRACARYLAGPAADQGALGPEAPALAALTYSFVVEVMGMEQKDLAEIRATAGRLAALLATEERGGKLNAFYAKFRGNRQLRAWLQREAVYWALQPAETDGGPLVTTRGYELLFSPDSDNRAWFHRELLLIAVLENLYERGWRPVDAEQAVKELPDDPARPDDDEAPHEDGEMGQ